MMRSKNRFKKRGKIVRGGDIAPDEIFLDSQNLPGFNTNQFEGRIEKPISSAAVAFIGMIFVLIAVTFVSRVWSLQINQGEAFAAQSERNSLRQSIIFSDRGVIYDVHNTPLAWNLPKTETGTTTVSEDFSKRQYTDIPGLSNLLGYVTYPKKDKAGFYFEEEIVGVEGIETIYDDWLSGENGREIVETDALLGVISQSTTKRPEHGRDLRLTIDADVQSALRNGMVEIISNSTYVGGGGVVMDIFTGEVLALVSFPEFDSNVLSEGEDREKISEYVTNPNNPFLNRVVQGLYTPGSVVKPFLGLAALTEGIISPTKQIVSTGSIEVPNPYDPDNPSIFNDWKAHGAVDMRDAIAQSSNVYFYEIGGGFGNQEGLGIDRINKYLRLFGFGESIESKEFNGYEGVVPSPEWKEKTFLDDPQWRVGDTYFTSIGQYGFQATPLQVVSAVAAIANEGTLVEPHLISDSSITTTVRRQIDIDSSAYDVVKEGMRMTVTEGSAIRLNYNDLAIAAKTGTAELGVSKARINSWVTGFFPYENPRYAFTVILENGDRDYLLGGVHAAEQFFNWLKLYKPEYVK